MTVLSAKNAAIAAAKILGEADEGIKQKVRDRIENVKSKY